MPDEKELKSELEKSQIESEMVEESLYGDDGPLEFKKLEPENYRVYHTPSDPDIESLYKRYEDGDLIVDPEFQRKFVWDPKKSSNLIESILLDIPIPPVFITEDNGHQEVIDGQQRLTSIFSFIRGKFPVGNPFKLSELKILKNLSGKRFSELSDDLKKKIRRKTLHVVTINSNTDENIKFEMFERLNTNLTRLNAQELRNCMYRGKYNNLMKDLAKMKDFQFIIDKESYAKRMLDVELVLLFCSFIHKDYHQFNGNMKQWLNEDLRLYRDADKQPLKEVEEKFKSSVYLIQTIFGKEAFRVFTIDPKTKQSSFEVRKLNQGLFLILIYGFSNYKKNQIMPYADILKEELLNLQVHDEEFIDSLTGSGTNSKTKTIAKFEIWLRTLQGVLGYPKDEPRAFSFSLKNKLWGQNKSCKICGQQILDVNDAEVDHIICYWKGGKTVPENARLTHRFCNRQRGGKD